MGWSDVVHCVRVPLTGTTMAVFVAYGSVVGIVFCILYLLCVQYCGLLGAALSLFCNGPTSWQCSQAYMWDLVRVHVIISFGDCSVSLLCPMYWAVPHRSAGAQHSHSMTALIFCFKGAAPCGVIHYPRNSKIGRASCRERV